MQFKDYYAVLGVPRRATEDEIKRAYRKLARKFHPDVSKETDAEARFKEVGEAYEVLKDPEKRAAYDRFGSDWKAGQEFRPPPGWDAGFEFRGDFGDAGASGFSEFFESLFGGAGPFAGPARGRGGAQGGRSRGENHHARILVSLEDAYRGSRREVQLQMPDLDPHGHVGVRQHRLNVTIPKGVVAGQQIRLAGQGGPGTGGAPRGDLYLEIEFEPHRLFRAEGRDIHITLPVTPWEAALGARVPVQTLGGTVELTIPPGAQSGQKLRLKGRGLPGQPPGNQYVELRMVTPPATNADSRALYQRMSQAFDFNPRSGAAA
jgi:curved DNA-binding protein